MRPVLLLGHLTLLPLGCAPHHGLGPIRGGRNATVGCYRLSFGPWQPPFPAAARLGSLTPPSPVRLDKSGVVTPRWAFFPPPIGGLTGEWRLVHRDSLLITWDGGEMGIQMYLTARHDSLAGEAAFVVWRGGDSTPQPAAAIIAIPVSCP